MSEAGTQASGRLREYEAARLLLARLHVDEGASLAEVVRDATEIAAGALEVDRVGVWFFADQRRALRCAALFERGTGQHSSGATLRVADFPNYFRALEQHRDISAAAARVDPVTHELEAAYLEPLGIRSMLDAPIYRRGEMVGVICHERRVEHVWSDAERDFADAAADAMARLFEEDAREDAEARLRSHDAYLNDARKMEALGRLAAGIAHDFRNLLTVVIGCADEIRRSEIAPRNAAAAGEILKTAERGAALVNDLLAFGREEARTPRVLDLGEVVDSLANLLRTAVSRTHPIEIEVQRPVGRVLVDRSQIERVLLNLSLNARDAMPRGGTIRICVREETVALGTNPPGAYVLLEVADTGDGMDAAIRERLFEPFFTTKAPGKGSGIGLAVVYRVVERCGGYLQVDSEPGQGTRMRIYLPRVAADGSV